MAIAVVGSSNNAVTTAVANPTLTLTCPTGTATGHVLVAAMGFENDGTGTTIATPSGWTKVGEAASSTSGTTSVRIALYYRVATSADVAGGTTYNWTSTSAAVARAGGGIVAYSGVDTATPGDAAAVTAIGTSVGLTHPGITTATANAWVVGAVTQDAATTTTITAPAGYTERWQTAGRRTEHVDAPQATAGASGSLAWGQNDTSTLEHAAIVWALRPAATGGGSAVLAATGAAAATGSASGLSLTASLAASGAASATGSASRLALQHALAASGGAAATGAATRLILQHALAASAAGLATGSAARLVLQHALVAAGAGAATGSASLGAAGAILQASGGGTAWGSAAGLRLTAALVASGAGSSGGGAELTLPERRPPAFWPPEYVWRGASVDDGFLRPDRRPAPFARRARRV